MRMCPTLLALILTILLYVNRQAIDSFSDGSYSSGQTGFVVDSSGVLGGPAASTEVAYNYQKVWTF